MASPKSPKSPATAASPGGPGAPQSPSQAATSTNPVTETGAEGMLVADDNLDEGYDLDDNASSSASITSSILRYRQENGRTYHAYKDGAYVYPNDGTEQDRLDVQHYLSMRTFGDKLFLSPIDPEKTHRVLDCGTGTGCWAMDYGDEYPNAEVFGIDLSPIQPEFTPPNVQFYVDDLEDEWTFDKPFDFIYSRHLTGSVADWPKLFKQAYDNLAPGGYFELADICTPWKSDDGTLSEETSLYKWSKHAHEISASFGRPLNSAEMYASLMKDVGFVKVEERIFRWPSNRWPLDPFYKELGALTYENVGKNLSGLTLAPFTRGLGWSHTETEVFLVNVRKDFKNRDIHAYLPVYVVYGQKPLV